MANAMEPTDDYAYLIGCTTPPSPRSFFTLPAEIRKSIYEYLIMDCEKQLFHIELDREHERVALKKTAINSGMWPFRAFPARDRFAFSIIFTCKTCFREAQPLIWKHARFSPLSQVLSPFTRGVVDCVNDTFGSRALDSIRTVYINQFTAKRRRYDIDHLGGVRLLELDFTLKLLQLEKEQSTLATSSQIVGQILEAIDDPRYGYGRLQKIFDRPDVAIRLYANVTQFGTCLVCATEFLVLESVVLDVRARCLIGRHFYKTPRALTSFLIMNPHSNWHHPARVCGMGHCQLAPADTDDCLMRAVMVPRVVP